MCLRLGAVHFSPLHKPTTNLPGWIEIGVRFLVAVFQASSEEKLSFVCLTCGMSGSRLCARYTIKGVGHGVWSPDSEESANGKKEGDRSPLCVTSSQEPWDRAPWQKAFPQDYFGLASLGASFLSVLTHYPGKSSTVQLAEWLPRCECCFSCPLLVQSSDSRPFWSWGNSMLLTQFGDASPPLFSRKSENWVCSGTFLLVDLVCLLSFNMLICPRGLQERAGSPANPLTGWRRLPLCGGGGLWVASA